LIDPGAVGRSCQERELYVVTTMSVSLPIFLATFFDCERDNAIDAWRIVPGRRDMRET
jgi:hypothetical protein